MKLFKDKRLKVVGFKHPLFRVYKVCGVVEIYVYQFRLFLADRYITISKGNKKSYLNKITLSFLTLFANLFFIPSVIIPYYPVLYFEGAVRFFTNSHYINGIRFFNFVNIAIIILLSVLLFLK